MSTIDQTTARREGLTCYEQDEHLCTDTLCKPGRCIIRESTKARRRIEERDWVLDVRKLGNEIIEQCAKAVENLKLIPTRDQTDSAYNQAIRHGAEAVRALKDE